MLYYAYRVLCRWLPDQGWEDAIRLAEVSPDKFSSLCDDIERNEKLWKEVFLFCGIAYTFLRGYYWLILQYIFQFLSRNKIHKLELLVINFSMIQIMFTSYHKWIKFGAIMYIYEN